MSEDDSGPRFSEWRYQLKQLRTGVEMVAAAGAVVLVPTLIVLAFTDLTLVLALLGAVVLTVVLLVAVVLFVRRMGPPMM